MEHQGGPSRRSADRRLTVVVSDSEQAPATPGDFADNWDPVVMRRVYAVVGPVVKRWYRPVVRGLDRLAPGGALIVSNHSGGALAMDIPVLMLEWFNTFGYDRPVYALAHDGLFRGPQGALLGRTGLIRASRDNAEKALRSGATVIVFPGGDYDAYRPTLSANVIDFGNRTGYVGTALAAGVPIVPVVSIGGQENQLYLSRGQWLAKRTGTARLLRTKVAPITFGIPFGFSVFFFFPINVPLPTKIVTEVLEPIDIKAQFGDDPDISEVDTHVRKLMQSTLDRLAEQRRRPVLG